MKSESADKEKIEIRLDILRRQDSHEKPYWQSIFYETEDLNATVASALTEINQNKNIVDIEGKTVGPIRWECSCLQKKCGACAMIIDGQPKLACNSFLRNYKNRKKIIIEPLRKFPVIADLIVDRSILFENLKRMKLWAEGEVQIQEKNTEIVYEASRCLQCGCCLEVCPNFYPGGSFFGAAGFVPTARLLSSLSPEEQRRMKEAYLKHEYEGCGKSLACAKICPAEISVEKLLVNLNASVFRRKHV